MSGRRLFLQCLAAEALTIGALPRTGAAARLGSAAPEFVGLDSWTNVAEPPSLARLRGKVVLVDFWTYSCINCRRTVPYLNRWQAQYGEAGLRVVGIHSPEFGFEHMQHNAADAVREFGIRYPVGQDNGFRTWRAWGVEAWPSFYLLNRAGRIVLVREGEGHARELEGVIRALLGLPPGFVPMPGDDPDLTRIGTPEMYFGALHSTPQDRGQQPQVGEAAYRFTASGPRPNNYQLDGSWLRQGDALVLRSPRGAVWVRFSAAKLHLVAAAPQAASLHLTVDTGTARTIKAERPTLYTLLDSSDYAEHVLVVEAEVPGLSLFSATFG